MACRFSVTDESRAGTLAISPTVPYRSKRLSTRRTQCSCLRPRATHWRAKDQHRVCDSPAPTDLTRNAAPEAEAADRVHQRDVLQHETRGLTRKFSRTGGLSIASRRDASVESNTETSSVVTNASLLNFRV